MEGTPGHRRGHAGTGEDARGPGVPSPRGDNPPSPTAPGDTGSAVSLASPRDPPGDTEPDGDKVCAVCGDRASGYHFHVMSCEGCKGFFRRSIIKGVRFTCPLARRCPVTKAKRRQCQACRLQKCLDVGMRKDMIMSEEALRRRRELRGQRGQPGGQRGQQGQAGGQQGLTAEQQELIALLIAAHQRTFDSSFSQFSSYWPAVRLLVPSPRGSAVAAEMSLSPREEEPPDAPSLLPQFADLSTFMIQQVIKFAKEIPVFRSLPLEAQISLLKGATLGICQIRFNTVFNPATKAWECGQRCYTIRDGALGVLRCAQVYLGVPQMFPGVLRCAPGVPRCAPVCPGVLQVCPGMFSCAPGVPQVSAGAPQPASSRSTWSRCSSSTRACGGCGCTRPSTRCCRPCCSSRQVSAAPPGTPRCPQGPPAEPECPLPRPRGHRPARCHRPVPGEGGGDAAELHRAPAPAPRGQVPVRQAAAAADGAADAEGGEHAADPAHPRPVGHDAAALRDHQLSLATPATPPRRAARPVCPNVTCSPGSRRAQSKAPLFIRVWHRGET
ncbi:nuclear receptor subfamily 1 group I member 3 isoform X2 [Chamaea fasciata]|uniref:nuclear receptor subfamily 1 group I member 3 isoform X2 n=1 Tax=Chamaea fasciata TaxID=190680 RepID=UPI00336A08FC